MLHRIKDYKIIEKIASGGMADVYKAEKIGAKGFKKIFAIKLMKPEIASNPQKRQMFINEAELIARLIHPNIVQIFELGEEKDLLYIVMEYVHGKNLKELMKILNGDIDWKIASYIIYKSSQALYYAHNLKDDYGRNMRIVHRDISPQNVMVTFSGEIKLADFGIARLNEESVKKNILVGKYPYMSPEQTRSTDIDYRSDIFSLGIVYYQLLTGKLPFIGQNALDIIKSIRNTSPVPPKQLNPEIPQPISNIVMKCLEKEPDFRYLSALDIAKDIEKIIPNFISIGEELGEKMFKKYTVNLNNSIRNEQDKKIDTKTNYTRTITTMMDMLREDPNNLEYLEKIGTIYSIHGEYDKAMEYFTRGLAIDDSNFLLRFRLAQIFLKKKDKFNFQYHYSILKKISPNDEHLKLLYLQNLIVFKKWEEAEQEIKKLKKEFSNTFDFLILEAEYYLHKKKYSRVINNYLKIAELEPEFYFFNEEVKKLIEDLFYNVLDDEKNLKESITPSINKIGENKKALVIDDDKNIRILIRILLEDMGFSVDLAKNAVNIDKLFEIHQYDLLILDVLLPGMNGFKLLKKLKSLNLITEETKIIMISGVYKSLQFKNMAFKDGVSHYLEKPFTTQKISKIITNIFNERVKKRI